MNSGRLSRAATTLCLCAVGLLISSPQAVLAWTAPRAIAEHRTPSRAGTPSSLAIDSRGRWHLVYGDRVRSGAVAKTLIRYLSSASRRPATIAAATSNVDARECTQVGAPSIAADREGGLHVTFERNSSDCDDPLSIMYRTRSSPGGRWSPARTLARHRPHFQMVTPSSLAVDRRGRWHLVYGDWIRSSPRDRTVIRYLNSASRRPARIATATNDRPGPDCNRVGAPSIAAGPTGALHLTFERGTSNCDAAASIMHTARGRAGERWSRPRAIAQHGTSAGIATPSSLAVDRRGRWHVVYGDLTRDLETFATTTSVRYLSSASRDPETIATASGDLGARDCTNVGSPSIAANRKGGLHVVFERLPSDCDAPESIMYVRSERSPG